MSPCEEHVCISSSVMSGMLHTIASLDRDIAAVNFENLPSASSSGESHIDEIDVAFMTICQFIHHLPVF